MALLLFCGDVENWSRITKYILSLRSESTKCSLPQLAVFFFSKKENIAALFNSRRDMRRHVTPSSPKTQIHPNGWLCFSGDGEN